MDELKETYKRVPGDDKYPQLPIIPARASKVTEHYFTHYKGPCAAYELDLYRCLARTGAKRGNTECREYIEDFRECAYGGKTVYHFLIHFLLFY